jgi:hypothetical protein
VVVVKRLWLCWLWFAHASGIVLISLAIGWMLISWFATTQPVIQPVGLAQLENARVPVGGEVVYHAAVKRFQSCPGVNLIAFTSGQDPPAQVTLRRKLQATDLVNTYYRTTTIALPRAVTPGLWDVETAIQSECPTRVQVDQMHKFTIEVYQP